MKDLRYVYMTAIFSTFLLKSIRATERCTKYLRYVYTTTKLSTFLITTTILFTFLLKLKEPQKFVKRITTRIYNCDTFYIPCKKYKSQVIVPF